MAATLVVIACHEVVNNSSSMVVPSQSLHRSDWELFLKFNPFLKDILIITSLKKYFYPIAPLVVLVRTA
jgi:hypothetical protein